MKVVINLKGLGQNIICDVIDITMYDGVLKLKDIAGNESSYKLKTVDWLNVIQPAHY